MPAVSDVELDETDRWRLEQFLRLHCSEDDALLLAWAEADWHQAEQMVEQGCPPRLLVNLLA